MKKLNVLISSSGGSSALNVMKSLRMQKEFEIKIISVDSSDFAIGNYFSDKSYKIKDSSHFDYIRDVLSIAKKENVQIFFPIHSKEIPVVSKNCKVFEDNNIKIILPSFETVEKFNDK